MASIAPFSAMESAKPSETPAVASRQPAKGRTGTADAPGPDPAATQLGGDHHGRRQASRVCAAAGRHPSGLRQQPGRSTCASAMPRCQRARSTASPWRWTSTATPMWRISISRTTAASARQQLSGSPVRATGASAKRAAMPHRRHRFAVCPRYRLPHASVILCGFSPHRRRFRHNPSARPPPRIPGAPGVRLQQVTHGFRRIRRLRTGRTPPGMAAPERPVHRRGHRARTGADLRLQAVAQSSGPASRRRRRPVRRHQQAYAAGKDSQADALVGSC